MFNYALIILGLAIVGLAYLVGVKRYTWLLSGYNQHRVKDKELLAKIVGIYNLVAGTLLIFFGLINIPSAGSVVPFVVGGYIVLLIYVNTRMVE